MTSPRMHAVADPGMIGKLADRALPAFERGKRLLALRRQRARATARRAIFGELARALERGRGRQHHPQHRGQRREVIIGGPFAQAPQRRGDRRHVDARRRAGAAARPALRWSAAVRLPGDAEQLARAQRRDDDRAGLDRHALGHAIIERPERCIQGDDTGAAVMP